MRWVCVVAFAGIVSGCITSDQDSAYVQAAKPRQVSSAKPASERVRPAALAEQPRPTKPLTPQIVLGAAY